MSRLDLLISFMDHLDEKSTSLLQSARNTSSLVAEVTKLHSSIAAADSTIGLLNDSIASNYSYLHRIDQLHERSFFLESSLSTNDFVTNQNTWSNLYAEYKHILNHIEGPVVDISTPQTINTEEVSRDKIDLAEVPRLLSKIISVSDMQLKPIRCREKKMYKKKSKYRLSHIYNINPLASSPILEVPNSEEEIDASSSFDTQEDDEVMIQIIDDSTVIQNDNDHNSNNNTISTTSDDNTNTHNRNQLTIATSPETSFAPYSFSSRMRSNSVPEITFTHGGLNIFNTEGIMQASNILTDFTKGETEDSMRLNRLKHFISIHGLSKKESEHLDEPMGDVSLADSDFTKTPNFTPIDLDHPDDIDILDIDACSDFSYYSPEKTEDIDDDFEKYLRKSRVDLQNAFPAIHRSTSHESVFSNHIEINIPKWKFHNPIDNTASTHSTGPTIKISDDYIHSYKGEFKDGQKTTTNLLSQMMKDTEPPEPIPIKPKKITASASASPVASSNTSASSDPLTPSKTGGFSLFNFSASPFSTTSFTDTSTLSKSFSDSIRNLVQLTPEKKRAQPKIKEATFTKTRPTKPILVENPSQKQRLPRIPVQAPTRRERNDGTHSKLTIGPNKTKIIKHGEQSYFKKPLVSKVSHNSLHEALNFRMM